MKIKSITEFPFKDFFNKSTIYNRNSIQLIINPFNILTPNTYFSYNRATTEHMIRKTSYHVVSEVIIAY